MSSDPYIRPTLTALRAQAAQDITTSSLPGADGLLQKAVLRVMSWVMAGFAWLHYDYLDFIYQQSNPLTATGAAALRWGGLIRVTPKPAAAAGTNGSGMGQWTGSQPIPQGTPVFRQDGFQYTTTATANPVSNVVTAPLLASQPGSVGNAGSGTVLMLGATITGVNSSGLLSTALTDGTDPEDIDTAYKARYLAQYAAPVSGGDAADYVNWALAVPGVTRAWVIPVGMGAGSVVVYTMFDITEASVGGFPQGTNGVAGGETRSPPVATGDQLTVANALYPLRPVTALVFSCAPTEELVEFTIANLSPNTSAMQAAIEAALSDMFLRLSQVGGSINPSTMTPYVGVYPSDWNEAIDSVPGLVRCTVVSPSSPIMAAAGQLLTRGDCTFSG